MQKQVYNRLLRELGFRGGARGTNDEFGLVPDLHLYMLHCCYDQEWHHYFDVGLTGPL